jgi:hypothetical protein
MRHHDGIAQMIAQRLGDLGAQNRVVQILTMKVARSALRLPRALGERAGVRETVMAAATYIFRGGADAMAVK